MFHLYTQSKHQKTFVFRMFSGVKEMEQWAEMSQLSLHFPINVIPMIFVSYFFCLR